MNKKEIVASLVDVDKLIEDLEDTAEMFDGSKIGQECRDAAIVIKALWED